MSALLHRSLAPLALTLVLMACWVYPVAPLFQYQWSAVQQGEWWRLFTGHWVHIDHWHLAVNLAGVWLIWLWCGPGFGPGRWLLTTLVCSLTIGAGLYLLDPDVAWYRGFSGVLFGLFAAGSLGLLSQHPILALAGLAGAAVKLALDATGWQILGVGLVSDFRIIHQAHLYGFVSGLAVALAGYVVSGRPGSGFRPGGN